jgi:hypothetical protein
VSTETTTTATEVVYSFAGTPLAVRCTCENGMVQHSAWAAFWRQNPVRGLERLRAMPDVDYNDHGPLRTSDGRFVPEEEVCSECEGVGARLTREGRDLMAFLGRFRSVQ